MVTHVPTQRGVCRTFNAVMFTHHFQTSCEYTADVNQDVFILIEHHKSFLQAFVVHSDMATSKQGLSLSNNLFSQSGDLNPLPTLQRERECVDVCLMVELN